MKVLFLLLGLGAFLLVVGGMGAVAHDTYPALVQVDVPPAVAATPTTEEGNPTLLIVCVIAVVLGLAAGIKS